MHRLRIAGYQRVPPGEILAFRDQAVGAGRWQPLQSPDIARGESHAISHLGLAVRVVTAAAFFAIEELAAHVREQGLVRVFINELVQAAAAAAVAEAFPLGLGHFRHGLAAPKRSMWIRHRELLISQRSISANYRCGWLGQARHRGTWARFSAIFHRNFCSPWLQPSEPWHWLRVGRWAKVRGAGLPPAFKFMSG